MAQFFRLGITGFGGPAAHIAMMHDEFVTRRKWLSDEQFLDLNGATNLIPGPNSTELAIHIGYLRAGWIGLVAAGVAFILPSMVIVLGFSWLYVSYGTSPDAGWLLYGIKPVIIALLLQAIWVLGGKALINAVTILVGISVLTLFFLGVNEIILLFAGGLVTLIVLNWGKISRRRQSGWIPFAPFVSLNPSISSKSEHLHKIGLQPDRLASSIAGILQATPVTLTTIFLTFLKIGSILYGSGYVLVAYLQAEFVTKLGWMTNAQVADAIAIGQITPGPVFTTATFIGFLLAGPAGGVVATIGIFLPAFVFVALSNPLIPRIRKSNWAGTFLDGINAASLGLMAAASWIIAQESIVDLYTAGIGVLSAVLLIRYRLNSTWLIIGGAVAGFLYSVIFA